MPTEAADARLLLRQPPDAYVTERMRLVKQARADGDRPRASFYQSLKRPNLSLWAVLTAGDDADAVHDIIKATSELARIQSGGAGSGEVSAATQRRRKALEALVDKGVAALAGSVSGAEARRPEIRDIVEQLSRDPSVADAWIDGTLRELPDGELGFAAFAEMQGITDDETGPGVVARARPTSKTKARRASDRESKRSTTSAEPAEPAESAGDRAARAQRTEEIREARKGVATASRLLAVTDRRIAAARDALRDAQDEMRLAEHEHAVATERHAKATARLDASTA
ncbi:MAG: hypothetical protein ABI862_00910 [Ilumatobacteraceae bacterium]